MRVRLIKKLTIENYLKRKGNSNRSSFEGWLSAIKHADWEKPADIIQTFSTADVLGKGCKRVVFNVGGNNARVICKYAFGEKRVHLFVCWIGTHAEYTRLCELNRQYYVESY
jgi:mRNA interferase HigB